MQDPILIGSSRLISSANDGPAGPRSNEVVAAPDDDPANSQNDDRQEVVRFYRFWTPVLLTSDQERIASIDLTDEQAPVTPHRQLRNELRASMRAPIEEEGEIEYLFSSPTRNG